MWNVRNFPAQYATVGGSVDGGSQMVVQVWSGDRICQLHLNHNLPPFYLNLTSLSLFSTVCKHRGIAKTSGVTRGVCKNRGFYYI